MSERPVTVTIAARTAIVFSGLWVLLGLVATSAALAGWGSVVDDVESAGGAAFVVVVFLVLVTLGVVVLWAAVATLRRSRAGRVTLVVMSALSGLFWLFTVWAVYTVLPLVASVVTVVLLFSGGADDWFGRRVPARGGPHPPPGRYGPGPDGSGAPRW